MQTHKLLLDENVERRLALSLKRWGYDIKTIGYDYPKSLKDKEILAISVQEKRTFITSDYTDYYDLIFRRGLPHCGVIVLRFNEVDLPGKERRLLEVLRKNATVSEHTYLIVTPSNITIPS